ncbi:thymidylate synthase [Kutzneria kofuensis]|uniref:Thymidylate synthase n=1 Tax=Kutzneria kofuensis TaxID=103725 RepID=A0A7W9KPR0_9PSEU|nr:thymidylate synthase [Kutzneria kofuensis]MBB5896490.1 thymidylate synthase [Kutzneria kofuensis]
MSAFDGLQEAYLHHIADLLHEPQFRNSPRGYASQERLGVRFTLRDPLRRLVTHPARRTNLVFNFAEVLWYLAGRDDLAYLAYYAPSVAKYSADGQRLTGTAYGPRIFDHGAGAGDQWEAVTTAIREDPDTKRAVIQIFQPRELLVPGNPDVACTLALQFLLREGRMHMVAYMRANDAYRGMASDVFSFTCLLEAMARKFHVPVGSYTHVAGSLHLYQPDLDKAARLLECPEPVEPAGDRMPEMPDGDNRPHLDRVLKIEEALRVGRARLDADAIEALDLPSWWAHVVRLFELYRRVRAGQPDHDRLADHLPPLYRRLLRQRFPSLAIHAPSAEEVLDAAP